MGSITFGVPEDAMNFLANKMALSVFVEGGTYKGDSALKASKAFTKVITIENSETMYLTARQRIGAVSNIHMLQGDTRAHLQQILAANDNILFWLDAHWSGGETYGKDDECPLIEELALIFSSRKKYIVLIDDARLFLAPPPRPHKHENWPSLKDIVKTLPDGWDVIVYQDVVYLFPESIKADFKDFIQKATTGEWQGQTSRTSLLRKILK